MDTCLLCRGAAPTSGGRPDAVAAADVHCNVRAFADRRFRVLRCSGCGSLHSAEDIDDAALAAYYAAYPYHRQRYDLMTLLFYDVYERRLRRAGVREDHAILDYGCGSGHLLRFLAWKKFKDLAGYDAHSEHFRDPAPLERRYDCIIAQDVVEHVEDPRALLQTQDYAAAEAAQRRAIELDPDNLEQYLALGEILVKAGKQDASAKAYADYEVRRAGLIDGLTLRRDGAYIVGTQERVACAQALASASDVGTAFALLYALQSEPDPAVRAAIATTMGIHRLAGYKPRLTTVLAAETSPEVREAIAWALGEIDRDPVDTKLDGPPPPGTPGTAAAVATGAVLSIRVL